MSTSWKQNFSKAITFSYDDAVTQDIHLIELLNKYNLKGTFNLNSELLGKKNILIREGQRVAHYKIAPEDVKYVYEGHEVAVHTLTHPLLPMLEEAEIIRQVEEDRKNLEALVGYDVVGMAYPGGGVNNDDRVAEIIKNNTKIRYCRTTTNTDNFDEQSYLHRFNPNVYHMLEYDRLMEMGQRFLDLTPDKPQIFYIWGHAYEMDYDPSYWPKMEEFFKLISGRSDIFYGTNAQVLLG
ncbi:MAG: polysaccharide deacetylase family protein [Firmicutes bacterium]|nr:polysaccharide deacetylase family protein [Bacillota bacterium]